MPADLRRPDKRQHLRRGKLQNPNLFALHFSVLPFLSLLVTPSALFAFSFPEGWRTRKALVVSRLLRFSFFGLAFRAVPYLSSRTAKKKRTREEVRSARCYFAIEIDHQSHSYTQCAQRNERCNTRSELYPAANPTTCKPPLQIANQIASIEHFSLQLHLLGRQHPQHLRLPADPPLLRVPGMGQGVHRRLPQQLGLPDLLPVSYLR